MRSRRPWARGGVASLLLAAVQVWTANVAVAADPEILELKTMLREVLRQNEEQQVRIKKLEERI